MLATEIRISDKDGARPRAARRRVEHDSIDQLCLGGPIEDIDLEQAMVFRDAEPVEPERRRERTSLPVVYHQRLIECGVGLRMGRWAGVDCGSLAEAFGQQLGYPSPSPRSRAAWDGAFR